MSNIYGTFVVRHISDYPNWSGWHYAMNANREILPRMFYYSMDTGWTTDDFNLEYWLDEKSEQPIAKQDDLLDEIMEHSTKFFEWVSLHGWEYDYAEQKTHTVDELFNIFKSKKPSPFLCLPISELSSLLCDVSQLISGWNATESEWSKWDEEVRDKVSQLQQKIEGRRVVKFLQQTTNE